MVPIQRLPVELLERVFTIGSETDFNVGPYSRIFKRHMKPFIVKVSLVCRHWSEITHAKGKSRFWRAVLDIGYTSPFTSPTFEHQAYEFKKVLAQSNECDLVVWMNFWDLDLTTTRIMIHLLMML